MRRILDGLVIATLTLAGALGAFVSIADLFGLDVSILIAKKPDAILLLMLSLLSASIGLERAMVTNRQTRTLETVEKALARSPDTKQVEGKDAIYKCGIRLVDTMESRIRSIVVADGNKAPVDFSQSAAARLNELDRQGKPARFDVVLMLDKEMTPDDLLHRLRTRHQQYVNRGVGHLVAVHVLYQDHPVGMDYLIIDRRHVSVAFTPTAGTEKLMTALVFEDQPEVAGQFAEWFDQRVLPGAERVI